MEKIYFDNAATTPLRQEVIEAMIASLTNDYGNPSSSHSFGRTAKNAVETSRKSIAKTLGCTSKELVFTTNATEASNWILSNAVINLQIERIITTKIEHHATLYTIKHLHDKHNTKVDFVNILPDGSIDMAHLVILLNTSSNTIVSLMHVNNEIGTVLDIHKVGRLCKQHKVLFHCDAVQSVGKFKFDLQEIMVDFLVASAHKFHGPKGIGFAYIKNGIAMQPMLFGGEQEKGLRAGTEAIHQIVGMAKAIEISNHHLVEEEAYISELKSYCTTELQLQIPDIKINGINTFYNIINVLLPYSEAKTAMILFNLDMKGIAVSRGSACQSGSPKPSHVLAEILSDDDIKKPSLRISFSHFNTKNEIDIFIDILKNI